MPFIYLGVRDNEDVFTEVDIEDHEYLINLFNWRSSRSKSGKLYATVCRSYRNIYMHRVIAKRMGLDMSNEIDHKDRDPLNNKRNNLRSATRSQNEMNRKIQKNNTTGFPGVSYKKSTGRYEAHIKINQRKIHIGYFDSAYLAHLAREEVAKKLFGEFYNPDFDK